MKRTPHLASILATVSTLATFLLTHSLQAQTAGQDITLVNGWNAVWLEVEPVYQLGDTAKQGASPIVAGDSRIGLPKAPADVFDDPAVLTVISPKPLAGTAEFFAEEPTNVTTFNQAGWEQWNNPSVLDTDNLNMITGNRPYLIKASGRVGFTLQGKVRFQRPVWAPDRYNLIGFGLEGAPTFDEFFGPAKRPDDGPIHPTTKIFRLLPSSGNWVRVTGGEAMASNQAYWVFSSGPSNYMGPVAVDFDGAITGTLNFGGPSDVLPVGTGISALELDLKEIVFTNLGANDASPVLDLINPDPDSGSLALSVVEPNATTLGYQLTPGAGVDTAPGVTASPASLEEVVLTRSTGILTLGASRDWTLGAVTRTNIYRLRTGAGSTFWLPVTASRSDILQASDTMRDTKEAVTGLWVGEVSVTGASSFVENGAPIRPTATPAPLRLLLHSDIDGKVSLLSQVTLMQTKTADPAVPPAPVLVVNRDQIRIFEGIRERNGKLVGVRLEAVAFEMPRDTSPEGQRNPEIALTGCATVLGSTTITCASTAGLEPGMTISGATTVAAETKINSVTNNTTFVVSKAAIGSGTALDLTASDDVLDMVVAESNSPSTDWLSGAGLYPNRAAVTKSAIEDYLLFRSIRPPALKETYKLALDLDGALGAGKTVQTKADNKLILDSFHRANPFRHAFHQKHGKGPLITRELTIVFDAEQPVPDRLRGTYEEKLLGVTKSTITLTGSLSLQRVTPVPTLEGVQ